MVIIEDEIILQLMREESPEGYRMLFDKYHRKLCLQAFLLLQDSVEAEDLVQELFVKFWREKKYLSVKLSLSSYLSVSVRNSSFNVLKQRKRTLFNHEDYVEGRNWVEHTNLMEIREINRKLEAAMDHLPGQCRKIFELVCMDGRKYKDASEMEGISVNTVKTQLRRAFSRLREGLKDRSYFEVGA